jgi:putative tryptophan/tyrosine transport system substrate-binding protein
MRLIGLVLALSIALAPMAAEAQAVSQKTYRVGYLTPSGPAALRAWETDLAKLGYIEGRNLIIERRYADGKTERLPALASELVRLKVDVIVATGPDAIVAAMNATTTIPIVMAFGLEQHVASLARPGGNVTGVAYSAEGTLMPKRFELLKQAVPPARRIGMLDDGAPRFRLVLSEAQPIARSLDLQLVTVDARGGRYKEAFAKMKAQRVDAVYGGSSPFTLRPRTGSSSSSLPRGTGFRRSGSGDSTRRAEASCRMGQASQRSKTE